MIVIAKIGAKCDEKSGKEPRESKVTSQTLRFPFGGSFGFPTNLPEVSGYYNGSLFGPTNIYKYI